MPMRPLAIYIHVPFCAAKCAYCDFASWPNREHEWQRYFDALFAEIDSWAAKTDYGLLRDGFRCCSLFIGGGTPTLVPAGFICDAIERCRSIVSFDEGAEITIEGNPGTLTEDKLALYRKAGVDRISLGAQSFDDALLVSLGRIHTSKQIAEAVRMARREGFSNINLDLMYGLPGQTMGQWRDTLDAAVALDVTHISAYSLIVEEGTPMAERVNAGEALMPDDDVVNDMQREAVDRLEKAGFRRYEISNYARKGFECRHNLTYWQRGDYLGLGCAAHSMLSETRFCNPVSLSAYLAGERMVERQELTIRDVMEETLMLSTRTVRGLDMADWQRRFGVSFMDARTGVVERLSKAGYIELMNGFLRLTRRGLEVQNAVVIELLDVIGEGP
ncbi:MAG: radical SAM family heme chaperone HemW [Clostridia bacterium]|nr:radical SAM family heme chaperone HemW [Clostridia bacterium]